MKSMQNGPYKQASEIGMISFLGLKKNPPDGGSF
jgi:hypothetical protein